MLELTAPTGSPENPISAGQLEDKFRDCAAHALKPMIGQSADEIINLILDIEAIRDSRELINLLSRGRAV